jgi:predicted transcriptional regulator
MEMTYDYVNSFQGMHTHTPTFNKVDHVMPKETEERRHQDAEVRVRGDLPIGDINSVSVFGVNALARFEAQVMEAAWQLNRQVAVAEILERMQENLKAVTPKGEKPKRIAYTSVLTTVTNLAKKGYLLQDRNPSDPTSRNAYMYKASMSKREYEDFIALRLAEEALRISPNVVRDALSAKDAPHQRGGKGTAGRERQGAAGEAQKEVPRKTQD